MNELIASFQKNLGPDLNRLYRIARYYKMCFLMFLLMGTLMGSLKLSGMTRAKVTLEAVLPYFLIGYGVVAIPFFLQSPLNFLPDRYLRTINLGLKRKILFSEINKYHAKLELFPDSALSDDLLFEIGLLSDTFRFGYGDDYLQGTFNGLKTGMSVFHVRNLFYSVFNGFVAEVHFPKQQSATFSDFTLTKPWFSNKFQGIPNHQPGHSAGLKAESWLQAEEELAFIALRNNVLYLGVRGTRKMFESTYPRLVKNPSSCESDLGSFAALLRVVDTASRELTEPGKSF